MDIVTKAWDYYVSVLKQYVTFSGRAKREEYWYFVLVNLIITIVILVIASAIKFELLSTLYSLALLLPSLAVGARRLHDTGKSGWWLLIGLIPLIGAIVLIYFFVQDTERKDNEYGKNPKAGDAPSVAPTETPAV